VQRYDPSAFAALILYNSHPHQLSQIRPILEKDRRMSASWSESAHVLTVEKALKTTVKRAQSSITKEMRSMVEKRVFVPVEWANLTPEQLAKTIRSSMFLKGKVLPEPKLKSRFVAGGNMQDRSVYSIEETSSPTVSNSALYMIAAIAAHERRKVRTMDVGSAFLNADIRREVLMIVQPSLAKILCSVDPTYDGFLREDGSVVVKLLKALCGCIESSKLWFEDLREELVKMGFTHNQKDHCVFNVIRGGHQMSVCIYVDDLFATSIDVSDLEWLSGNLEEKY
jgi:hypothetical protein